VNEKGIAKHYREDLVHAVGEYSSRNTLLVDMPKVILCIIGAFKAMPV
jgi:hypothetical protein